MRTRAVCTPAVLLLLLSASAQAATKAGAKPGDKGGGTVTLTPDSEGKRPTIAADAKGTLYVAFEGAGATAGGPSDVLFTASTDGGKTWSKPADLSNTPGATADPAIAVGKDGSIVVVWTDAGTENHPDIFAVRSTDGGKTWSKPADVSATPGVSSEPDVKVGPDGAIHVVWLDTTGSETAPDVWFAGSTDGGKTWSKAVNVSNTPGKSMTPSIAMGANGAIAVVWCDTTSGAQSPDVFFSGSTDGGKTWSKSIDVSNTPGISSEADVTIDAKGHIYVAWTDTSASAKSPDIMVSASTDGGKTWSKPVDASNTPGVSADAAIASTGAGTIAVVWVDTSEGEANADVWSTVSTNGGKSFKKASNLSKSPGMSKEPDVTVAGGKVYAVWEEIEDGKSRIKLASFAP